MECKITQGNSSKSPNMLIFRWYQRHDIKPSNIPHSCAKKTEKVQKSKTTFNSSLSLQCNDLRSRIHDGALSRNGPANGVIGVRHVDDDNLGSVSDFFPYADEFVTLHGEGGERNVCDIDSDIGELAKQISAVNF